MTIAAWIGQRDRRVPDALRVRLRANAPVSLAALLRAGEEELTASVREGGRPAAFSLLAADAYVTYACLWALLEEEDRTALRRVTERLVRGWNAADAGAHPNPLDDEGRERP